MRLLDKEPEPVRDADLISPLSPKWPEADLGARIPAVTRASGCRVLVLDDDPTGTDTERDLPVLTEWTVEALSEARHGAEATVYVLPNCQRSF